MNVVLIRVLFAQKLWVLGHPRFRAPQVLLSLSNVLPAQYPIVESVEQLVDVEHPLGRLLDRAIIARCAQALYASATRALNDPRLFELVDDGAPAYAWPRALRTVWTGLVPDQKSVSWASSVRRGAVAAFV